MSPQKLGTTLGKTPAAWTSVSFSGAGHLLAYHLGVSKVLLERQLRIQVVAGSSSGAIAATMLAYLPHRLEEFTETYLQRRGLALTTFREMITQHQQQQREGKAEVDPERPALVIATTKCHDASLKLFKFDDVAASSFTGNNHQRILKVIEASCHIPISFHPFDMFSRRRTTSTLNYPNEEGIQIDGEYYADGGISAPAPIVLPSTMDAKLLDDTSTKNLIIVSPISGGGGGDSIVPEGGDNTSIKLTLIRPMDKTLTLPGGDWNARCGTFQIRPSIQNLRAMINAMGVAPIGVLDDWHKRGIEDAERILTA